MVALIQHVEQEIVEAGSSLDDAQKFVEHHLKAEECYEFYRMLRGSCTFEESAKGKRKK